MILICPHCCQTFLQKRRGQIYCCIRHKELFGLAKRYRLKRQLENLPYKKKADNSRVVLGYTYNGKSYRLSKSKYFDLLNMQNGRCSTCGKTELENKKRLALDHNHITGQMRELLCHNCNAGSGLFQENPTLLRKHADYLQKYQLERIKI